MPMARRYHRRLAQSSAPNPHPMMRFPCAIALFLPTLLHAQDPGMSNQGASDPYMAPTTMPTTGTQATNSYMRGSFGLALTNAYYFRGILQENQGIIAQPHLELGYDLIEAGSIEGLHRLDLRLGSWNSLDDHSPSSNGEIWYESDFYIDLTAGLGERLTTGVRYTAYTSPNGSFNAAQRYGFRETVQELAFTLGYDDRQLLLESLDSGLQPYFKVAFELDGQRDNGLQSNEGIYGEVGVRPSFALQQDDPNGLRLAVPIKAGFSFNDYYEDNSGGRDDFFGYLDVGAEITTAITFLPERMGPWQASAGLHWLLLGDNNEERNGGDTSELIVSVGVSTRW